MEFDYKKPTLGLLELVNRAKDSPEKAEDLRKFLLQEEMLGMYKELIRKAILPNNEADLKIIEEKNVSTIEFLERKKNDDPENENHVFEIDRLISEYYSQILDLDSSELAMNRIRSQNLSSSLHMDILLCKIRTSMLLNQRKVLDSNVQAAKDLCEKGCDWDRRNKFKIYEAVYFLRKGLFMQSAILFSESLATFESDEICSYEKAALYTIFTGMLSFERGDIKERIILSSNILEAKSSIEEAYSLAESFYHCNYSCLFVNLIRFLDTISGDVFIGKYKNLFCREVKLKAYKQLLKSYESLSLVSMANIFGVSVEYIEKDVIKYIVSGKLICKIDKVDMTVFVVEEEPNMKNEFLESGDELLRMIKKKLR